MENIRTWLNGTRNYDAGIQLYIEHGGDTLLKRLFTQEGFSEYKLKRLTSALQDLLKPHPKQNHQTPHTTSVLEAPAPMKGRATERKWSTERDEVEQSLFLQWKEKYSEMINLSARVGDISKEATIKKDQSKIAEAGRMALRILDLDDECDVIFGIKEFYKTNGRLPDDEGPLEIAVDPKLWYKKLHNHQRYLRKFRVRVDQDPTDTDAATLLKKHEWAVSEYKKLLKMD